jgi:hypothetical protein
MDAAWKNRGGTRLRVSFERGSALSFGSFSLGAIKEK